MDLELDQHLTVVTGGASGIGRAIVETLLQEKCRVAIWDITDQVAEVADACSSEQGTEARGFLVDVTKMDSLSLALRETLRQQGAVDHLVHCAAVGSGKFGFPFTNIQPEDWSKVLDVNVMGMVNVTHAIGPVMIEQGHGSMIFLSSVAGQIGSQTDPPYSASKAANINFAQCVAKDMAPHGIRVNTICPGMIQTPLNKSVWQAWYDQQPADERLSYELWAGEKVRTVIPLGRWQQPQDIADMAVFILSERAANVTGQTINVDGGFVTHW